MKGRRGPPRVCPPTSGSKILEGWIPPYDATITRRVLDAGIVMLGKDEHGRCFAMGFIDGELRVRPDPQTRGTCPGSRVDPPVGRPRRLLHIRHRLSIGTDTGGSIRQPAAG